MTRMNEVTRILSGIEAGDPHAAEQLLPLVYGELRQLAAHKLAQEKPGQTLQATALVLEAYLRLVDTERVQDWNSRRHFFGAAAEAMRRILVQKARRRSWLKHGGGRTRMDMDNLEMAAPEQSDELLALDEALTQLAAVDAQAAELVSAGGCSGLDRSRQPASRRMAIYQLAGGPVSLPPPGRDVEMPSRTVARSWSGSGLMTRLSRSRAVFARTIAA
jgi:RNA polymerase sigma factor (TIGR02999 family)